MSLIRTGCRVKVNRSGRSEFLITGRSEPILIDDEQKEYQRGGLNIIHFKSFEKIHNLKNITNFQFARQISSYEVKVTHGVGEPEVAIA